MVYAAPNAQKCRYKKNNKRDAMLSTNFAKFLVIFYAVCDAKPENDGGGGKYTEYITECERNENQFLRDMWPNQQM